MNFLGESPSLNGSEIAIIGLAGRFPGARTVNDFWNNLQNGVESISFFTDEELLASGIESAVLNDPKFVKARSELDDVELFDAEFFSFNPKESEITDPQHRLFLECAWEALENAGYDSETYKGSIGVYAGSSLSSYLLNVYLDPNLRNSIDPLQIAIAGDKDYLTTRVSYKLNLEGPSYTVQTACSTSLVAVHLACQSLLNGECDMALAGGVSINASRKAGYFYQEGGIYSPDGHCRAFDAQAQGTVGGEGVGIVVLKRLEDALADGDSINAVIKGSAINNDGSFKVSYTAPRIDSQAKVIKTAQVVAEVEPETITYIEAHGTGTSLGDPIEIAALTQAFGGETSQKGFCAIGSLKTNIGHLGAAAGVAGLIKTVLALKHQQIPPSLHFEKPNAQIDFANSPFYVNTSLSDWQANGTPRRAGVSSFGIGGTNAHVVLEEAPAVEVSSPTRPWQLLLLSAKTSTTLETATANLANYLQQHPDLNLADVAHTLQVGRRAFDHRRMLVCQTLDDAVQALSNPDSQRVLTHYQKPGNCPVAFMFSGQGSQYVNMALELYQHEPIFTEQVDDCCEQLKLHLGLDLRHVLYPSATQEKEATQQLQQTHITQPALFVIEYALAKLWMAWGVYLEVMIGHSIGEYVAATLAGVFSLEDALAIVATRGRLMQQLPSGAMLSVQLPEQEVKPLLTEDLALAGSNSPTSSVVSGSAEAIAQLQQTLQEKSIPCRRLHTSHAFHSPMVEPMIEPFTELLRQVTFNPPQIPFVSNLTGTWITPAEATDPNYWARHLRQPVRFSAGVTELLKTPERVLLEVGPGRTLSTFAKQHQINNNGVLTSLRHPQEQQSDIAFLLNSLGRLWLAGVKVDWSGFYAHERRHHIPLPTYPFERQRYWIEPNQSTFLATARQEPLHKKPNIADWFYMPVWKQSMLLDFYQGRELVESKSCWLVFVDACGVGSEIAKRLEQQNHDVIIVRVGDQFSKISEYAYTINPQQRDDYDALVQELQSRDLTPQGIAHFWSITASDTFPSNKPDEQTQSPHQFFEDCQNLGFYSLLFLAQALGEQNVTEPLKLMVVTSNVHEVTGDEKLFPEKATVLGPCKVIPQEYPNITCCSFDVVIPEFGTKLIDHLIREFTVQPSDLVVAYRGNHRWAQTFEAVRLNDSSTSRTRLREGGVYVITGGLGGIGLVLAEYLAKTVQAKLILIGRRGLPERSQWTQWLATHDSQDKVSQKIQKVQTIEELGAEVLVISADVANEQQMQTAISQTYERFGAIHGVIHAAGNLENTHCAIQETSQTDSHLQFQPKVYGLFVLEKVLQGRNLDFVQLTSSLASILGGLGFVSYSAANIFMDAFVSKHNQADSCPWISVNWDGWGLSEEGKQEAGIGATLSKLAMSQKGGVEAFRRVLSMAEVPQVVVSTGNLQTRIDQWLKLESLRDTEYSKNEDSLSLHSRSNLPNAYVAPRNEAEQTIANIWRQALGIEQVGIHDDFFELGGDSLMSIQVISRLRKEFQIELSLHSFFERPTTVAGLAERVEAIRLTLTQASASPIAAGEGRKEIVL